MSQITITLPSKDYEDHDDMLGAACSAVASEHGFESAQVEAAWGDDDARDEIRVTVSGLSATHYLVSDDGPEAQRISLAIEADNDKAAIKLAVAVDATAAYDDGRCDAEDDAGVEGLSAALESLGARRVCEVSRGWALYAVDEEAIRRLVAEVSTIVDDDGTGTIGVCARIAYAANHRVTAEEIADGIEEAREEHSANLAAEVSS